MIERTEYKGWHDCYRISNSQIELVVTGDVGPRIMRLAFVGGQNFFKEFADQLGKSAEPGFQLRGGHRLWVAPETLATSWAPDNSPVQIEVTRDTLTATEPAEPTTGVQKQLVVQIADTRVEVRHRIKNANPWTVEFAPWAMSVMAPGGTAITGFPPRGKHPEALLPTNPLVMWAYTDLNDPRWRFTKKYLALRQDPKIAEPQKIGLFNPKTWAAYLLGSELFVKQSVADPALTYPDFGCSFETFTNADFLELETLGPLTKVQPGAAVEHIERWSLHRNVNFADWTDAGIDKAVGGFI